MTNRPKPPNGPLGHRPVCDIVDSRPIYGTTMPPNRLQQTAAEPGGPLISSPPPNRQSLRPRHRELPAPDRHVVTPAPADESFFATRPRATRFSNCPRSSLDSRTTYLASLPMSALLVSRCPGKRNTVFGKTCQVRSVGALGGRKGTHRIGKAGRILGFLPASRLQHATREKEDSFFRR